jgi:protein O-GlcNAc transferase
VSAWGYTSGTGITAMDYLFADAVTIPPELERYYTETVVRLPVIFPYAHAIAPGIRQPAPHERNGFMTYGYLGRGGKITPPTLDVWAQVLRADPTSRMVLKSGSYRQREVYRAMLNGLLARGVATERVTVLMDTSREEHLMAHNDVDAVLDPMPQTGGISTCDALLMGVPVVTKLGPRLPERVSASILMSIGRSELVAETVEEYVRIATSLRPTVANRQAIRAALGRSALVDHPSYVRVVENTYRAIWARWCEQQAGAPAEAKGEVAA